MRNRSIGMMILLTIITFGLYLIYWSVSFQSELKHKTHEGFGGLGHLLFLFLTFGIYYIIWNYQVGGRLKKIGGQDNGVLYLVLVLISFGWLTPFLIQMEANGISTTPDLTHDDSSLLDDDALESLS